MTSLSLKAIVDDTLVTECFVLNTPVFAYLMLRHNPCDAFLKFYACVHGIMIMGWLLLLGPLVI